MKTRFLLLIAILIALALFFIYWESHAQTTVTPNLKVLDWADADSIYCRTIYATSSIRGVDSSWVSGSFDDLTINDTLYVEGNLIVNSTVADQETRVFELSADADATVGETVTETFGISINTNDNPINGYWKFTSTQFASTFNAFEFDDNVYILGNVTAKRGGGNGAYLTLQKDDNVLQTDEILGAVRFGADDPVDQSIGAMIRSRAEGDFSSNDTPGILEFHTVPNGSATPTERMRIDSDGYIGIGTTSPICKLMVVESSSGVPHVILTATDYNIITTTVAQAIDTAAAWMSIDGSGQGVIGISGADGDVSKMEIDNNSANFNTSSDIELQAGGSNRLTIGTSVITAGTATIFNSEHALGPGGDDSVSDDGTIDVTGHAYLRVVGADAEATNVSLEDGSRDGQMLIIQGTADGNLVTINDGNNCELAGGANVSLGQGDTITLIWDDGDSNWYELYRSDN